MEGNVEAIKERLDIADVIGGYIKIEKAGANFKAKCPFHNEKTASFFISSVRQGYYCFGCGAKGDIFSFVESMEGIDFRGALKILAEKAGVELKYESRGSGDDKEKLYKVLDEAMIFFEKELRKNSSALNYLESRGVNSESIKSWRLGLAKEEWRSLREHMHSLGFQDEVLLKTGLVRHSTEAREKEPYDTFRGRLIFPLFDPRGQVIAFSGRALAKDLEPKYLNSPDTPLFTKSEVLYGLDKAREEIRKKNYAVLVEGQLDLVLSHQAGVKNTVASSGTAFTQAHLEKLKRISPRIVLSFDGDNAGLKASERSTILALSLGMEVKVAVLPEDKDPADVIKKDPESWKEILRNSKQSVEFFLERILLEEKDKRKAGKLIESKILPLLTLIKSSIERSHFVSLISKKTGIREELVIEDLRRAQTPNIFLEDRKVEDLKEVVEKPKIKERVEEELKTVLELQKDFEETSLEHESLKKEERVLKKRLEEIDLLEERVELQTKMFRGEGGEELIRQIESLGRKIDEIKRQV